MIRQSSGDWDLHISAQEGDEGEVEVEVEVETKGLRDKGTKGQKRLLRFARNEIDAINKRQTINYKQQTTNDKQSSYAKASEDKVNEKLI